MPVWLMGTETSVILTVFFRLRFGRVLKGYHRAPVVVRIFVAFAWRVTAGSFRAAGGRKRTGRGGFGRKCLRDTVVGISDFDYLFGAFSKCRFILRSIWSSRLCRGV